MEFITLGDINEILMQKIDKITEELHQIKLAMAELNYWRSAITELQKSEESQDTRISKHDVLIAQFLAIEIVLVYHCQYGIRR
jgi:hypothetical protein